MRFFRLIEIYSGRQMANNVYNDERKAKAEFEDAKNNSFVIGAKLYEAEFEGGVLKDKECIAEK